MTRHRLLSPGSISRHRSPIAFRPASVIVNVAISICRSPALVRSPLAVASPDRTKATMSSIEMPCATSIPSGYPPGDRASRCRAPMEPIGLVEKSGKGWQVVHRCTACGHRQPNRLVRELTPTATDPAARVAGFHLYTFNEVARTERWRLGLIERLGEQGRDVGHA